MKYILRTFDLSCPFNRFCNLMRWRVLPTIRLFDETFRFSIILLFLLSSWVNRVSGQDVILNADDSDNKQILSVKLFDNNEGGFLLDLPLTFHINKDNILFDVHVPAHIHDRAHGGTVDWNEFGQQFRDVFFKQADYNRARLRDPARRIGLFDEF